jgi:uncharacterized alpha-E superfamily protein
VLSRAADAVYWMERYRERAENTARMVDCSLHLSLDALPGQENPWGPVVQACGDEALYEELYGGTPVETDARNFLTFDERNPNSILSCLSRARANARSVREQIPADLWQEFNTAYLFVAQAARRADEGVPGHAFYARVKRHCQLVTAIADAAMTRDEAWHFGRLGYMMERADKTSRLLDVKYFLILPSVDDVGTPYDSVQWSALLDSAGALEMFRKKHAQIVHANVVEFLALDRDFPRSILHCLAEADQSLRSITGARPGRSVAGAERRLGSLRSELGYLTPEEILSRGLHEFLNDTQIRMDAVHAAVAEAFFTPRTASAGDPHEQ